MKKQKEAKNIFYIFLRYALLIVTALPNLFLFYLIFTPLTIYPVNFILGFFYTSSIHGNIISINDISIELIEACIAGSAFYLLLLLNLSLPMKLKKRIFSIAFSWLVFLSINIARIVIFSILLINKFTYFDITHKLFWYALSGVIVFFVWFLTIKAFKISSIPFYTDLKFIYNKII